MISSLIGLSPGGWAHAATDGLKDMHFVMQTSDGDRGSMRSLKEYGLPIDPHFFIGNDNAIMARVEAEFGVCHVGPDPQGLTCGAGVHPPRPGKCCVIGPIFSNPDGMSPAVLKMKEQIVEFIEENGLGLEVGCRPWSGSVWTAFLGRDRSGGRMQKRRAGQSVRGAGE